MQADKVTVSTAVHVELTKGNKIAAIKLLRTELGLGLKEAKDIIERYLAENPALPQPQATPGMGGALMLLVFIAAVLLIYALV